jgi:DNA-binding Lrp family transcriptional regulator
MLKLKPMDYALIAELVKNPRLSDRQLSKILNMSQPTITRKRTLIERQGLLDYNAIPNLRKLGYQILAFIFGSWKHKEFPDTRADEMEKYIAQIPNILFISTGSGLNYDRMAIAVFKDYSEYSKTIREFKLAWARYFADFSSFIVSLQTDNVLRNFTFKPLAEAMKREHSNE